MSDYWPINWSMDNRTTLFDIYVGQFAGAVPFSWGVPIRAKTFLAL